MPRSSIEPIRDSFQGYQVRIVQDVLLALLVNEPSHAYGLRARLALALGPLADALNEGQVYVSLARLEKAGLVRSARVGAGEGSGRKVYEVTAPGRDRVAGWFEDASWPKPAPAEFHLKLVAAAAAGLAAPARIVAHCAPTARPCSSSRTTRAWPRSPTGSSRCATERSSTRRRCRAARGGRSAP